MGVKGKEVCQTHRIIPQKNSHTQPAPGTLGEPLGTLGEPWGHCREAHCRSRTLYGKFLDMHKM